MCGFNIVGVTLAFTEATAPPKILMCNPAAEKLGAKSEPEFREAKVKCIRSHPLLLSYSVNASQIILVNIIVDSELSPVRKNLL
jgi:hypothetical protein